MTTAKRAGTTEIQPSTTAPRVKEPRCLGQVGTTKLGNPIYAVERADGQVVPVVIPGREED